MEIFTPKKNCQDSQEKKTPTSKPNLKFKSTSKFPR